MVHLEIDFSVAEHLRRSSKWTSFHPVVWLVAPRSDSETTVVPFFLHATKFVHASRMETHNIPSVPHFGLEVKNVQQLIPHGLHIVGLIVSFSSSSSSSSSSLPLGPGHEASKEDNIHNKWGRRDIWKYVVDRQSEELEAFLRHPCVDAGKGLLCGTWNENVGSLDMVRLNSSVVKDMQEERWSEVSCSFVDTLPWVQTNFAYFRVPLRIEVDLKVSDQSSLDDRCRAFRAECSRILMNILMGGRRRNVLFRLSTNGLEKSCFMRSRELEDVSLMDSSDRSEGREWMIGGSSVDGSKGSGGAAEEIHRMVDQSISKIVAGGLKVDHLYHTRSLKVSVHGGELNAEYAHQSSRIYSLGAMVPVVEVEMVNMFSMVNDDDDDVDDDEKIPPILRMARDSGYALPLSLDIEMITLVPNALSEDAIHNALLECVDNYIARIRDLPLSYTSISRNMTYLPHAVFGSLLIATLLLPDQVDDLEESVKGSLNSLQDDLRDRLCPFAPHENVFEATYASPFHQGMPSLPFFSHDHIVSPHVFVRSPTEKATTSLIRGDVLYFHYTEDREDDSGWGCAYRSLQTLMSWYHLQGFVREWIVTHREIQKILVEMGDKKKTFVGSKQWIGAIEVGMCIEKLTGKPYKILSIASGEQVGMHAHELSHHFQTVGTPVMIGGGVLAYTLLGVHYDEGSSEPLFLILDPHYTGKNDIRTIINKGWCSWKKSNLFLKDSFYNFCLPQVLE
eukprot:TRINITY_DN622_c0_g1_i1.p1 TRINITY_DN622_c0_g1~~TRINITY_DN622_c0_g1_i1.p1  ORF type:complete len:733 (+),score=182.32 TRINITY_DN622_c0_g1_i1:122-2320(+)